MEFAVEIGGADHASAVELCERMLNWHRPPGRLYETAEATYSGHPLIEGAARAFFIKMAPGARVHRHRDPPGVVDFYETDHIVVSTNPQSVICWEDGDGERSVHLEIGKRYRIIDRGVMHWAENNGDTDRIHLLIQYPKISSRRRA